MLGYTMPRRCNGSIILENIRQSRCHILIDGAFNHLRVLIHASLNNGAVLRGALDISSRVSAPFMQLSWGRRESTTGDSQSLR